MKRSILILSIIIQPLLAQSGYFGLKYAEKILTVDDGLGPLHLYQSNQERLGELIHSRLWRFNSRLSLEADLLDTLPKDSTIGPRSALVCKLKDDIRWSDGKPIIFDDIAFTIEFYKKNISEDDDLYEILSEMKIDQLDEKRFMFSSNMAHFSYLARIYLVAVQILPEHVIGTTEFYHDDTVWKKPLSAGPFQIVNIESDENKREVFLNRNKYSLDKPENWAIQNVIAVSDAKFMNIIKNFVMLNEFSYDKTDTDHPHHGVDVVFENVRSKSYLNMLKNQPHITAQQYSENSWVGIIFNHDRPFVNSLGFRQAFDTAIDDTLLIGEHYQDGAFDLTGPFNPYQSVTDIIPDRATDDPDSLISVLKDQGYHLEIYNEEKKQLQWIDPSSGERTDIVLRLIFDNKYAAQGTPENFVLTDIKNTLKKKYGIKIETDGLSTTNLFRQLGKRDKWDLAFVEFQFGWSNDVSIIFRQNASTNYSNYKSNILESYLDLYNTTTSSNELAEVMKRIHRHCHENLPYLFLWHARPVVYYRNIIQNPTFTPQYFFTTIGQWGIEPR